MILRALMLTAAVVSLSAAQQRSALGGLPGSPMRMGFGPEGIAMGNALSAVPDNPMTGYYNPALLPFQQSPTVFLSAGFLALDRNLNFISFSTPVRPTGGISVGIINSGVSNIEERNSDGRKTGILSTSENSFLLSFGVRVDEHVSIGISTKILYYHLYTDLSSTTAGFDFGILTLLSNEWTIGASLQDLGSKYKWDTSVLYGINGNTTVDRFPVRKKLGVAYISSFLPLHVSLEFENIARVSILRAGASWRIVDAFVIRAGIDQVSLSDDILPKPAFGFTVVTTINSLTTFLSYSFVVEPYSPAGFHVLAVGVNFE